MVHGDLVGPHENATQVRSTHEIAFMTLRLHPWLWLPLAASGNFRISNRSGPGGFSQSRWRRIACEELHSVSHVQSVSRRDSIYQIWSLLFHIPASDLL